MPKYEVTQEPTIQEYRELASCLTRLQMNPDWKKLIESYLFKDFLKANTENVFEPLQPEENGIVRVSIRNIQNINWLQMIFNTIIEKSEVKEDEKE